MCDVLVMLDPSEAFRAGDLGFFWKGPCWLVTRQFVDCAGPIQGEEA